MDTKKEAARAEKAINKALEEAKCKKLSLVRKATSEPSTSTTGAL